MKKFICPQRTARLEFRPFESRDARALHAALADPEAMRYWSTAPHTTLAESEAWVEETIRAVAAGEAHDFIVLNVGAVIGKVGLWRGNEIGFLFLRQFWGRGFASEAVKAVAEWAFATLAIEEIKADVDPNNAACLKLLERLGFRRIGAAQRTYRVGGEWRDSVYLSVKPSALQIPSAARGPDACSRPHPPGSSPSLGPT